MSTHTHASISRLKHPRLPVCDNNQSDTTAARVCTAVAFELTEFEMIVIPDDDPCVYMYTSNFMPQRTIRRFFISSPVLYIYSMSNRSILSVIYACVLYNTESLYSDGLNLSLSHSSVFLCIACVAGVCILSK